MKEALQNLKDFLEYLEDKNIIDCKTLQTKESERITLINDLLKLDLKKFNSKAKLASTPAP